MRFLRHTEQGGLSMLASLLLIISGATMAAEPETKPLYAVPEVEHGEAQSRIKTASQTQIERLNALEGNNARYVQQLAGRRIDID